MTSQKRVNKPQAVRHFKEGQRKLDVDDYDGAIEEFKQASVLDPQQQEYMSTCGSLLAEMGRAEEAVQMLQFAVQRFPDDGYEKYMYLGQLLPGEEGIHSLEKGIVLLQIEADKEVDLEERKALHSQLASGLCSMAEMRMALMVESEPDQIAAACEPLLLRASQTDSQSPEPKQVLASLRYEQGRPEEALQALKESMFFWYTRADDSATEHSNDYGSHDYDRPVPSYEFRFETAKLLLELDDTTEDAVQILEDLLEEHDQDIHVIYLLALAYHGGGDAETALEIIQRGEAVLAASGSQLDESVSTGFAKLKEDIEQVAKLSSQVENLQP